MRPLPHAQPPSCLRDRTSSPPRPQACASSHFAPAVMTPSRMCGRVLTHARTIGPDLPPSQTMHAILVPAQVAPLKRNQPLAREGGEDRTLDDLILMCIRDALGEPSIAASLLQDRVREHPQLLAALIEPYMADACWTAVKKRSGESPRPHDDRRATLAPSDTSARLHALADSLLELRLPNGVLLRDAFAHDLRDAAKWYLRRAHALRVKGRWLEQVADRVPKRKVAGDVLSEEELRRLLDSVSCDLA